LFKQHVSIIITTKTLVYHKNLTGLYLTLTQQKTNFTIILEINI